MQSPYPEPVRDVTASGSSPQPRQRWAWTYRYGTHLLVASIVAVILIGTGLVVAVVALGGDDDQPSDPGGTDCVVGTWQTVESEQHLSGGLGTVILADDGPVETYGEDGTGMTDYGDGVTYQIADTPGGLGDTTMEISGTATYDYELDNGTIQYSNIFSGLKQSDDFLGEIPTTLSNEPYGYECEADTLTFHIDGRFDARLERLDS